MPDESELAARARAGETEAFESILRLHGPLLYRIAYAVLGNPDDAQDALQEVIVRVLLRFHRLDPRRPVLPWLRRVMVNECLSRLRRRKTEQRAWSDCPVGDVSSPTEATETVRRVREALVTLPPKQRVAITLVGFEGMDQQATAQAMGCSVGAVKSHLHRAREKLRARLDDLV